MQQLLYKRILEKAVDVAPDTEIVCQDRDGEHRYTYTDLLDRTRRVGSVLEDLGVEMGDAVSTFAPNSHAHLELTFAVPMMGAKLHTASLGQTQENVASLHQRVPKEVIATETEYLEFFEAIDDEIDVGSYLVLDADEVPDTDLDSVYAYETLVDDASASYAFPDLDESHVSVVGNSTGTTGDPKIFDYNQRAHLLYCVDLAKRCEIDADDTVMLVPPLWYHNGWAHHLTAALVGAKLVIPRIGESDMLSGETAGRLIEQEDVTFAGNLSTVIPRWTNAWREHDWQWDVTSLDRMLVVGTSLTQTPSAVMEEFVERTGSKLVPTAGFSEVVSLYAIGPVPDSYDWEDQREFAYTGGQVNPLCEVKLIDPDTGEPTPRDGETPGSIGIRGPYVTQGYFDEDTLAEKSDDEGFLYPGDVCTITENGVVTPLERVEDLIEGEEGSISPSQLSAIVSDQPWSSEVATIGMPHGDHEIPVVFVVVNPEREGDITEADVEAIFEGEVEPHKMPEVEIIDEIPIGKRGKRDPRILKEEYKDKYAA